MGHTKKALSRYFKRRVICVALVFIVTTFWILYLVTSAPAASDSVYTNGVLPYAGSKFLGKGSVTRMTIALLDSSTHNKKNEKRLQEEEQIPDGNDAIEIRKQVIPRPPPESVENILIENMKLHNQDIIVYQKPDARIIKTAEYIIETKTRTVVDVKENLAIFTEKLTTIGMNPPVVKKVEDKVKETGGSLKNKTIVNWEKMKNKTLEKLSDIGVIKKPEYIKLVYAPVKWNLNLSMEDIGNIIKDTEYFQKKQNLTEMEYQPLQQPNSSEISLIDVVDTKYGLGYCDCRQLVCMCCVRIFNKWMRLNNTGCSMIQFLSKSQELHCQFLLDKEKLLERKIAAEFPPKICLESQIKVAGMCILFSNVTTKVNIASDSYKFHLSGCMEFDLVLFNKTVSSFPVGCFSMPGKHTSEEDRGQNLGNFMP